MMLRSLNGDGFDFGLGETEWVQEPPADNELGDAADFDGHGLLTPVETPVMKDLAFSAIYLAPTSGKECVLGLDDSHLRVFV